MTRIGARCDNCSIGRWCNVRIPYPCRINGRNVIVSNVPANLCDICGYVFYRAEFIHHLHYLIDRNAGSGNNDSAVHRDPASAGSGRGQQFGRSAKS